MLRQIFSTPSRWMMPMNARARTFASQPHVASYYAASSLPTVEKMRTPVRQLNVAVRT